MAVCDKCACTDTGLASELIFSYVNYKVNYFYVLYVGICVIYSALNCCSSDFLGFHMHNSVVPDNRHYQTSHTPYNSSAQEGLLTLSVNIINKEENLKAHGKWQFSYTCS
jgi:hypothetical protein